MSNQTLVPALLNWFASSARDLPWRRTADPYAIWVSEIMLQQTQVKTVIPYWERWMQRFPTIEALARARPATVLKLWEGLGYYTRARNLHRAARLLAKNRRGQFPADFNEVLSLPGIGRYTAGAICSIAFNQPTPVLDGNVMRLLTRLYNISEPVREKPTQTRLWHLAEILVQRAETIQSATGHHCSHFNQALMELGALICTPRQPKCSSCPINQRCLARRNACAAKLPNLGQKAITTERRFVAFVVEAEGRFLLLQRPAGVLNARLWEFPNVEVTTRYSSIQPKRSSSTVRLIRGRISVQRLGRQVLGFVPPPLESLITIRHAITRYRISLAVFHARAHKRPSGNVRAGRWCMRADLRKLALTAAHRKIADAVADRE